MMKGKGLFGPDGFLSPKDADRGDELYNIPVHPPDTVCTRGLCWPNDRHDLACPAQGSRIREAYASQEEPRHPGQDAVDGFLGRPLGRGDTSGFIRPAPYTIAPLDAACFAAIERASVVGEKEDDGKAELSRLGMLSRALAGVAGVQAFGAIKYPSPDNWKHVPNGNKRYRDAAMRHVLADLSGERFDADSGQTHLAHAITNLAFALEHDAGFAEIGVPAEPPVPAVSTRPHWRFPRRAD